MSTSNNSDTGIAVVAHIVGFATSFIGPLIMYLILDDGFGKQNAANALNWQIMVFIYLTISGILAFVLIGLALIPLVLLLDLIFCIIAAVKASKGEAWSYPITYDFV